MTKRTIPEELDSLIQEYLTDGIITEQERKVLLRKAERLGLDVSEIDLYITAQEQKMNQEIDSAARKKKGQICPFCGNSVPQLADRCPNCGQNITVEASKELKDIIENLEEALIDFKSGKNFDKSKANVERYIRKANLYYSNNPKIQQLLSEVKTELKLAEKAAKKNNLVKALANNKNLIITVILAIACGSIFLSLRNHNQAFFANLDIPGIHNSIKADSCISTIQNLLNSGDPLSAEQAYRKYIQKHDEKDVRVGAINLITYFASRGDWAKSMRIAESFSGFNDEEVNDPDIKLSISIILDEEIKQGETEQARSLLDSKSYLFDLDTSVAYENKIVEKMLEKGQFSQAEEELNIQYWSSLSDIDNISKILLAMENAGKSKKELKIYIDNKINAMDEEWYQDLKEPLREAAYGVVGITN